MADRTEAWMAVVQDADGTEEAELVSLSSRGSCALGCPLFHAGDAIELTNGTRITLIEPAGERAA